MKAYKILFFYCALLVSGRCEQDGRIPRKILDASHLAIMRASAFHYTATASEPSPDVLWKFQSEYWSVPLEDFTKWNDKVPLSSGVLKPQSYDVRVATLLQLAPPTEIILDDVKHEYGGTLTEMQWSPKGTWAQLGDKPIFYRVEEFPDCIVRNTPFQQYLLGVWTTPTGPEELGPYEPFLDTYIIPLSTVSIWEDENTVYTLKIPKDSYTVFEGTYLLRHRIMDQEVDFFLRSVRNWEKLREEAVASGDPKKFYNKKWECVLSSREREKGPIRPVQINFTEDELPDLVLKHPEVLKQKEAYQGKMREFTQKMDNLQKERERVKRASEEKNRGRK